MKTAAWSTPLDPSYCRIGISRDVPRQQPAGFKKYRKLAPVAWFNNVSAEEYQRLYRAEILDRLDPRVVADDLAALARGREPVLVCFERPGRGQWCHRAMVAAWLAAGLGQDVPEIGYETRSQVRHPLLPQPVLRPHSATLGAGEGQRVCD
jgi:hypothetical protein